MFALVKKLAGDKKGVTAIEYGLIAALISVTIIATVNIIGVELREIFTAISGGLAGRPTPTP